MQDNNVLKGQLEKLKNGGTLVTVHMKNGFPMRGKITRFDDRVIILNDYGTEKLLYQGGGFHDFAARAAPSALRGRAVGRHAVTVKLITAPASETDCQMNVIAWSQITRAKYPELALLHHIPNGGSRNKAEAERLKKSGVKSGVPDLFLPVSRRGYHGAYIEMKRPKPKGRVSDEQKWWAKRLTEQGYFWRACWGFEEARQALEWYLESAADDSKCPLPLPKDFDQW